MNRRNLFALAAFALIARAAVPRAASAASQLAGLAPSSIPIASASSPRAQQTSRRTPDHGTAPMHIAQGSVLLTSSSGGSPDAPRSCVSIICCAMDSATISACAEEQQVGTTRFTPGATSIPRAESNTAAAKGPPVPRKTFSRDKATTNAARFNSVSNPSCHCAQKSPTQSGRANCISGNCIISTSKQTTDLNYLLLFTSINM